MYEPYRYIYSLKQMQMYAMQCIKCNNNKHKTFYFNEQFHLYINNYTIRSYSLYTTYYRFNYNILQDFIKIYLELINYAH